MSIARSIMLAGAVVFAAACGGAGDGDDTTKTAVDTSVTTKTVQDTAVITTDTTIKTDTSHVGSGTATTGATTHTKTP